MPRTTLLVAAALLAAIAPAQQTTPIQGVVRDNLGNLVSGAGVKLVLRNDLVAETQTDTVGTFRFDAPPSAAYQLHVVKPGLCLGGVTPENMASNPINVFLKTPPREAPIPRLIRVASVVQHARALRIVQPAYPANAKAHGVGGTVTLAVLIDEYGVPIDIQTSSDSSPFFTQAAIDAVKQWRYKTTALNCVPVQVESQIRFDFSHGTGQVRL
jgi:TonB family protein